MEITENPCKLEASKSKAVNNPAPAIAGMASKNENLAAFSGEIPRNIAIPIVVPDLEIPGIMAMA